MAAAQVSDAESAGFLEVDEAGQGSAWAAPAPLQLRRQAAIRLAALLASAAAVAALAGTGLAGTARTPKGLAATRAAVGLEETAADDDGGSKDTDEDKPVFKNCLCVFDIDRTLTGKQGWKDKCPEDDELSGVQDQAYATGTMLASDLAQSMGDTFCGECYHGIVTAGIASGPNSTERQRLLRYIGGTARTRSDFWQDIKFQPETTVVSSLVVQASDGRKQDSVRSMVQWWREKQNIPIEDEDVYFFDDIRENVQPFAGTGFNARQISCDSRGPSEMPGAYDGKIGGCGGASTEVRRIKGIHVCGE